MFLRRIQIEWTDSEGKWQPCPLRWIDNFAMRSFTADAVFDDTLPVADGVLEVGFRVPLARLCVALEDWFRRKSYIQKDAHLRVTEIAC